MFDGRRPPHVAREVVEEAEVPGEGERFKVEGAEEEEGIAPGEERAEGRHREVEEVVHWVAGARCEGCCGGGEVQEDRRKIKGWTWLIGGQERPTRLVGYYRQVVLS